MIKVAGVKKNYGDLEVLKGIDLEINAGEITSIVGASGAGKSTLLQILGTLDNSSEGSVLLDETDIQSLSTRQMAKFRNEKIGFVFQFHHLLPEFSSLENILMPGLIAGKNRTQLEKKATQLMQLLNIQHRETHKPSELSGGEQQRVAVARALINDPLIVFADEPSGNLDSKNAEELHGLFQQLKSELGQTFVIVTHNRQLADASDRVIELKDGIVVNDKRN